MSEEAWADALSDPLFVAAVDEGLRDVAAGRVVAMTDLTPDQRRLVLAVVAAGKASGERSPAMTMIAEPGIHSDMQTAYEVVTSVESIGPVDAEEILTRNQHNRPVKARISDLAREMTAGRWVLNGESIKLSASGRLLDGQHRLMAVVSSGATIHTVVVRGLPDAAQETVDIGIKRSLGDILALRGEMSAKTLAAALLIAWKLDNNKHLWSGSGYAYPTTTELLDYLDANPGIRQSVHIGHRMNESALRFPPSAATGLHYLMSRLDAEQADDFWQLMAEGVSLMSGHPILTLRKYLVRDLTSMRRMDQRYRIAITIKAWNAFRKNRSLQVIKWVRSGDKPEDYPVLI